MGIEEIRKLKEKKGFVMATEQIQKEFAAIKTFGNKMEGKFKSGDYECSKGNQFFRSKWEANYALYLDWLIKQKQLLNWEYEAETFFFDKIKLGTRSYRPDFKVFNNDGSIEYHEVKGYMDSKSKTKLKRMTKYFPKIKMVLIEQKSYLAIIKQMKGLLKFY